MSNDKKIVLTVVVGGTPTKVETNLNATLRSVAEKAINETHQAVKDLNRWEMTSESGVVLTFDSKVGDAGLKDGDTVNLNLRTGVTG
jgi:hypothetical protein